MINIDPAGLLPAMRRTALVLGRKLFLALGEIDLLHASSNGTLAAANKARLQCAQIAKQQLKIAAEDRLIIEDESSAAPDSTTAANAASDGFSPRAAPASPATAIDHSGAKQGHEGVSYRLRCVDGFDNFSIGHHSFSVVIAASQGGRCVAAVIYAPVSDELFSAIAGAGVQLKSKHDAAERNLQVSRRSQWRQMTLAAPAIIAESWMETSVRAQVERARIHHAGDCASLALAWLAAGRYDAAVCHLTSEAASTAGTLMVENAGGHCQIAPQTNTPMIVAANNSRAFRTLVAAKSETATTATAASNNRRNASGGKPRARFNPRTHRQERLRDDQSTRSRDYQSARPRDYQSTRSRDAGAAEHTNRAPRQPSPAGTLDSRATPQRRTTQRRSDTAQRDSGAQRGGSDFRRTRAGADNRSASAGSPRGQGRGSGAPRREFSQQSATRPRPAARYSGDNAAPARSANAARPYRNDKTNRGEFRRGADRDTGRDMGRDTGRDIGRGNMGRGAGRDTGRDMGRGVGRDTERDMGRGVGRDMGRDMGRGNMGRGTGRDTGRRRPAQGAGYPRTARNHTKPPRPSPPKQP